MNGVIWWDGKLIPIEKFAEALQVEYKREKDKKPKPSSIKNKKIKNTMNKTIISTIIFLSILIPAGAFASITPGSQANCTVWREGMPEAGTGGLAVWSYCRGSTGADSTQRIYELEVELAKVEVQLQSCTASNITVEDNDRIGILESKVSVLETSFKTLQDNIMNGLRGIVLLITAK
jgi:hypothetical protein